MRAGTLGGGSSSRTSAATSFLLRCFARLSTSRWFSSVRCGLGNAELVEAVGVEARAGAQAVDAAGFDLGQVGEQTAQGEVRGAYHPAGARERFLVGEVFEVETRQEGLRCHFSTVRPVFRSLWLGLGSVFGAVDDFSLAEPPHHASAALVRDSRASASVPADLSGARPGGCQEPNDESMRVDAWKGASRSARTLGRAWRELRCLGSGSENRSPQRARVGARCAEVVGG